eukprot:11711870-Alexandrium_andersonii.AAC.1
MKRLATGRGKRTASCETQAGRPGPSELQSRFSGRPATLRQQPRRQPRTESKTERAAPAGRILWRLCSIESAFKHGDDANLHWLNQLSERLKQG